MPYHYFHCCVTCCSHVPHDQYGLCRNWPVNKLNLYEPVGYSFTCSHPSSTLSQFNLMCSRRLSISAVIEFTVLHNQKQSKSLHTHISNAFGQSSREIAPSRFSSAAAIQCTLKLVTLKLTNAKGRHIRVDLNFLTSSFKYFSHAPGLYHDNQVTTK